MRALSVCPKSPSGKHSWVPSKEGGEVCIWCGARREIPRAIPSEAGITWEVARSRMASMIKFHGYKLGKIMGKIKCPRCGAPLDFIAKDIYEMVADIIASFASAMIWVPSAKSRTGLIRGFAVDLCAKDLLDDEDIDSFVNLAHIWIDYIIKHYKK